MKRLPLLLLLAAVSANAVGPDDPAPAAAGTQQADLEREAAAIAEQLGQRLRAELQSAMNTGGPMAAIDVCHQRALPVTAELAAQTGWQVGRTALRLRNPGNAPDAWERAVLEDFERRHAAGAEAATLSAASVVQEGNSRRFRYMKAIGTAQPCTLCHGAAIQPALAEAIRARYPADEATGFAPGALRGAFSLTKPLD